MDREACQASLSMGFPRQEYWSVLPFPAPGDLLTQGWNLRLLHLQADSLPLSHQGIYKVQSHKKDFQCWQEYGLYRCSRGILDNMYPNHTCWLPPFISKHLSDKKNVYCSTVYKFKSKKDIRLSNNWNYLFNLCYVYAMGWHSHKYWKAQGDLRKCKLFLFPEH